MINVNKIAVKHIEKDMQSGDAYYTVEVTIMEPGAAFAENIDKDKIKDRIRHLLSFRDNIIGGDN